MSYNPTDYMSSFHHMGFVVGDLDRSLDFYIGKLGFALHDRWSETPDMVEMGMGVPGAALELAQIVGYGCMIELMQYVQSPGSSEPIAANHIGAGHACFLVEHFNEFVEALYTRGVDTASPPVKLTSGQWVHLLDPDGIRIEIMGRL